MDGRYVKHEMEIILFEDDCAFVAVTVSNESGNSLAIDLYSEEESDK